MANPFASTHSLDTNPFDDPAPQTQATDVRLEQLRQRELDLQRREQELAAKAETIRKHGRNNWPPFFPLIFHSIPDEIPEASQTLITRLYQLWLVLALTLIINMVACITILIAGSRDGGRDVGASIGYVFFISITSFLLWYRPIYNGYMKASPHTSVFAAANVVFRNKLCTTVYLYFFFGGFHLLFSIYIAQDNRCPKVILFRARSAVAHAAPHSTGSAGLIQMIQMYANHQWLAGVFCTLATVGWTVQGLGNAILLPRGPFTLTIMLRATRWKRQAKSELAMHGAKSYFSRG
ncbi:Secretory carrier membrane protein 2 [Mycena chlorophos]|uniref:Secretory carrier membrane protein 2 n=1 Tax=Mycena chlorophos TaxID=658473 RepID=A0A8H6TSQ2_MYCCL|nr:Secretory carrier membrane protein 2 [Mycena chlorophos]